MDFSQTEGWVRIVLQVHRLVAYPNSEMFKQAQEYHRIGWVASITFREELA